METKFDGRIHLVLSACMVILEQDPELPEPAKALIIGAMSLLISANRYIEKRVK